jgi:signal transduction histidine kinase
MSDHQIYKANIEFGLLANFIHQIINPLNGVAGTLDNVVDGSIPQNRVAQRLKAARAQLEQAILLIRNLAYFSRLMDPIKTSDVIETCIIPQIIIEAAMFFQELGSSHQISIELENEAQFKIQGHRDLLRQVFMNIFDNAIKYGQPNSRVVITTWSQKSSGSLLVRISGKSIFIPPEERNKIFTLRYRGTAARDKVASGTGLGLFICAQILEVVHSATIEIERSRPSGETEILIRFPKHWI